MRRACYGGVSPYEVLVGTSKIVGLAQVRRRYGALLQAGVYLHWEPERLVALLAATPAERVELLSALQPRACGLFDTAGSGSGFGDVVQAWEQALFDREGVMLADAQWASTELAATDALEAQYQPLSLA